MHNYLIPFPEVKKKTMNIINLKTSSDFHNLFNHDTLLKTG